MMRYYESDNIFKDMAIIVDHAVSGNPELDLYFDKEIIKKELSLGTRHFVWLTRSGGTECFVENEVFLIDAPDHMHAKHYLNNDFTVNTYFIAIEEGTADDDILKGKIYPIDAQELAEMIASNSIKTGEIEVIADNGKSYRKDFETYNKHSATVILSMMEEYRFDDYRIKYHPKKQDVENFDMILAGIEDIRKSAEKDTLENLIA